MAATPVHAPYRADIDGVRAIAVLLVILFHASRTLLPGGFIGVDIFFVISGFLITGILLREMETRNYSILLFYARRIRRIFPALIVVLLACIIAGWWLLIPKEYEELGKHVGGAALFFSNFLLWKEANYFDTTAELKPLLHLWSLGVEEQFYIVWPFLLWLAHRFLADKKLGSVVWILLIVSIMPSWFFSSRYPAASFFLLHTRFWELLVGGALAYFMRTGRGITSHAGRELCAITGLALIVYAATQLSEAMPYPGWRAMLPVCGAALLLTSTHSWVNRRLLGAQPMVAIGLISYPLYLWHWPLLSFARVLYGQQPPAQVIALLVAFAFLCAVLTYQYVEKPFRFGAWRKHAVPVLLAAMLLTGGLGVVIESTDGFRALRKTTNPMFQDLINSFEFTKQTPACTDAPADKEIWCFTAREGIADAALYGDSHAAHLFAGFAQDPAHNWMLLGHSSCPPLVGIRSHLKQIPDACLDANRVELDYLLTHEEIHTVVLASLGAYYISGSISPQHAGANESNNWQLKSNIRGEEKLGRAELFERGLERTVRALEAKGKKVVLFIDVPEMDFMPASCIPRLGPISYTLGIGREQCRVAFAKVRENEKTYRNVLTRVAAKHSRLRIFDPRGFMCDTEYCAAGDHDMLYYHDSHHLSIRGSTRVGGYFLSWLNKERQY